MWLFVLLFIVFAFLTNRFLLQSFRFWNQKKVPCLPISGTLKHLLQLIFVRKSIGQVFSDIYNAYPELAYVGIYKVLQPAILVRDPELLQKVFISEFSSFHDNDVFVDEKVDPMFGKNPFALKGDRWRTVRGQLQPCFTAKKVRSMFPLIEEVGRKMIKYLDDSLEDFGKDGIEMKELASKFTIDVVATCSLGLDAKSFEEAHAEFREIGKMFLAPTPTTLSAIRHLCVILVPSLAKILDIKFVPDEMADYFRKVVHHTVKYREENNIDRGDFLDMMKENKMKLGEDEFSDEDIAAHASAFFGDGFETSSITLSYALFELASNQQVQKKLREEIEKVKAKNGGKLDYDSINQIEYLENVILEALRKYPPGLFLSKTCTKQYTLPCASGQIKDPDVVIEAGTPILISVSALQHDPKYYPDPERFDPDRFTNEGQSTRPKCTFLSFGEGPRICIGMRFGLTQIKVAIAAILLNFEIRVNAKTITPLEDDPKYFMSKAKGGIMVDFYKRR